MKKVSDYKLISETGMDNFQQSVKQALAYGWQPQGGAGSLFMPNPVDPNSKFLQFFQAMVKYAE